MKTVVAALIEKDGKYFLGKRKIGGSLGGYWEFPGGKVEAGETDAEALAREIVEELDAVITVGDLLATAQITKDLLLKLYACQHESGDYAMNVHEDIAWVDSLNAICTYNLAPADVDLLNQIA